MNFFQAFQLHLYEHNQHVMRQISERSTDVFMLIDTYQTISRQGDQIKDDDV